MKYSAATWKHRKNMIKYALVLTRRLILGPQLKEKFKFTYIIYTHTL